ncbi:MAG: flagellar assembly protein FliX [Micavibrio sp.]|nr:flagellar assembly protein FliX [Micavibrio sp.]
MKIEGPNKSSGAKGVSKTGASKGTGSSSFSGLVEDTEEAESPKGASGVMATSPLDALLSLQELGNALDESSKKAVRTANGLLDQLDRIRIGLLTGGIPASALDNLARLISQHRGAISDPHLAELLDDIDLRVQVELAKLGR